MPRRILKRFYHAYRRSTLVLERARGRRAARILRDQAFFDESYYLARYPEVSNSGLDAISHYCRWGDAAAYSPHPLFDPIHYSAQLPELPTTGGQRLLHFLIHGREAQASPHPLFDTRFYQAQFQELFLPGENPLGHYLREGEALRCWPHPFFDPLHYEIQNPDLRGCGSLLAHFVTHGTQEGRSPAVFFDPAWYLAQCPEAKTARSSPLIHYLQVGDEAGLSPHPLFDASHYSRQYPELARSGGTRLQHYLLRGATDHSSPHPLFDGGWYLDQHPELAKQSINPLVHYLQVGSQAGMNPSPDFSATSYFDAHPELDSRSINPLIHHTTGSHALLQSKPNTDEPLHSEQLAESLSVDTFLKEIPSLLAFYLPQYHPVPENDEWWGKGFTEWTNVSKARPSFPGHQQPQLPSELGFYDLRLSEVREKQANLAREYGISGFCYYYYWFEGRRILERPLNEVLSSGSPDFPFCICWANENWTRTWDGLEEDVLLKQEHSLKSDYRFIQEVLPMFRDPRYICVEGSPLLLIYRAEKLVEPEQTTAMWRDAAVAAGFPGIHLCAVKFKTGDPRDLHFDSAVEFPPHHFPAPPLDSKTIMKGEGFEGTILDYAAGTAEALKAPWPEYVCYKGVMPAWDNTARRGSAATIYHGASPRAYEQWLTSLLIQARDSENNSGRFIFINAWNEWAEGAHLEPDELNGRGYLEATRRALERCSAKTLDTLESSENPSHFKSSLEHGEHGSPASTLTGPTPILFIGHDAAAAGAQFVLLELFQAMEKIPEYQAHLVLQDTGILLDEYQGLVSTTLLPGPPHPGSESEKTLRALISKLQKLGLRTAVCNTVVTASAAVSCHGEGLSVLSLVHEQPDSIDQLFGGNATMAMLNRSACGIVGVSDFSVSSLQRRYGPLAPALSVIHPPMRSLPAPSSTREDARRELLGEAEKKEACHIVLGCGTLYPRKGPDLFIQIARHVKKVRPKLSVRYFWIGGALTANGVHEHQQLARESGVDEILDFKGAQKDVSPFFMAADSFALTSREDPFPLVNMEAMSFGVPVVGFSQAGGAPELIEEDAGIVVPYLDVEAMAMAIIRLAENPKFAKGLGQRAREKVSVQFSPDLYAEKLLDLAQSLEANTQSAQNSKLRDIL